MVLINMRIFKTILVVLFTFLRLNEAIPVSTLRLEHRGGDESGPELPLDIANSPEEVPVKENPKEDYFDQRQNGTENYRIHVDGLVLVVAPVEALLLAGGLPDNLSDNLVPPIEEKPKPTPEEIKPTEKPADERPTILKKSVHGPHLRLASILGPVLKKFMNHQVHSS